MHLIRWTLGSESGVAFAPAGFFNLPADVGRELGAAGLALSKSRAVLLSSEGPRTLVRGEIMSRGASQLSWEPSSEPKRPLSAEPTCNEPEPKVTVLALLTADGRLLPIGEEPLLVGRHPGCDVALKDEHASTYHCALAREGGLVRVLDLASTNGTSVDGVLVHRGAVDRRASLRVGRTRLDLVPSVGTGRPLLLPSPAMRRLYVQAARLARSRAAVLISGESGVGKEVLARLIHDESGRRGAFVALNSAVLQKSMASSELFGHVRGAFTGADRDHDGAFVAADGGTLFLDEIGELAPDVQAELLRAVELGRVRRLGDTREVPVDVRVVAATHRDLARMVGAGRFREDLYHRLCVLPVTIPPLRERLEDLDALADELLAREHPRLRLTEAARLRLRQHPWSGNARELLNVLRRAAVYCDGDVLEPRHLEIGPDLGRARAGALDDLIAEQVLTTYRELGNVAATARHLGLRRTVVHRVLQLERRAVRQGPWSGGAA
jgi:MoxR-like ATPase